MATGTGTSTATRTKGATRGAAKAASPRVDRRKAFAWLQEYRVPVMYEGGECLITAGNFKKPFRGPDLTSAVEAAMAAWPARSAGGGSGSSGPKSRGAGK